MKKYIGFILVLFTLLSCKNTNKKKQETLIKTEYQEITNKDYELIKPTENAKKVLVLFPGFPHNAGDTKREFTILTYAKENKIAVIYMNYNQKLWLEENEKIALAEQLQSILKENKLPSNDVYIGGYSSGGNVSLLIGSFLSQNNHFKLVPKGVFIIDSPIDLVALYKSSKKNLKRNFSKVSITESTWIIKNFENQLGNLEDEYLKYQRLASYTSETSNIDNLKGLKNTKIRLYTEPDTLWWKKNRMADYDQLNSYYIKSLSEDLRKLGFKRVEYISTENMGYRANGERHPHSWSIIDKKEIINWIME
ncbi:hypothetical protein [uncultured Maribacter sp.]|uniref:hypothetical protein n=2 Tax=uncultured Maribacter sp. TaxID=431308 RepID=UPI00262C9FB7|nr:hypothetical protein [uncultured Maribacter sp.]